MDQEDESTLVTNKIADLIKKKRYDLGISLQELSYRSGVNRSTISRIETYERQPNIATLLRLAPSLGFSCWELIKRAEKEYASPAPEVTPMILSDDAEKAFLKLRKKCLEKEDMEEAIIRLTRCIF